MHGQSGSILQEEMMEMYVQFLEAIVPFLSTPTPPIGPSGSDTDNPRDSNNIKGHSTSRCSRYTRSPAFIRTSISTLLSSILIHSPPPIISHTLSSLDIDALVRVGMGFSDVTQDNERGRERDLVRGYVRVLFGRFGGLFIDLTNLTSPNTNSINSSLNNNMDGFNGFNDMVESMVECTVIALDVISSFVEWCDITTVLEGVVPHLPHLFIRGLPRTSNTNTSPPTDNSNSGLGMKGVSAAVVNVIYEITAKGISDTLKKLSILQSLSIHSYLDSMFVPIPNNNNNNINGGGGMGGGDNNIMVEFIGDKEVVMALGRLLNGIGVDLCRICLSQESQNQSDMAASASAAVQEECMALLSQLCIPYYLRVFEVSLTMSRAAVMQRTSVAKSVGSLSNLTGGQGKYLHHRPQHPHPQGNISQDNLDGNDDDDDDGDDGEGSEGMLSSHEMEDVTIELVELSYTLTQLFIKRKDSQAIAKLFDLLSGKVSLDMRLLREYKLVIDLICSQVPQLAVSESNENTLWPLNSMGETKGRGYFVSNLSPAVNGGTGLTEAGEYVLRLLSSISQQSTPQMSSQQLEFVTKFNFVFNNTSHSGIANVFIQLLNRLIMCLQSANREKRYLYLATINRIMKTKDVQLVRNNQSLIGCMLNLLFGASFQTSASVAVTTSKTMQQMEVLNEGFTSIGLLIDDAGILQDLIGQLQLFYAENKDKIVVYNAIGYLIKGLLSNQAITTCSQFEPLYQDIKLHYTATHHHDHININQPASSSTSTTDPLIDSIVFSLTKLCQIIGRCDVDLFHRFFISYHKDLYAVLNYLHFKFHHVDPQVLEYMVLQFSQNSGGIVSEDTVNLDRLAGFYMYINTALQNPMQKTSGSAAAVAANVDPVLMQHINHISALVLNTIITPSSQTSVSYSNAALSNNTEVTTQKNTLLKSLIAFHRAQSPPETVIQLSETLMAVMAYLDQSNASFIGVLNEVYSMFRHLLQLNNGNGEFIGNGMTAELVDILRVGNEREGKKLFRQYFRHRYPSSHQ